MKDNYKKSTTDVGAPADNANSLTPGERGGMMLQDLRHMEKLARLDREAISDQARPLKD